jgi:3-keto-5-aminohexanoate cleavage enzyme
LHLERERDESREASILALAVTLGGHIRVGFEDNPYMAPGGLAKNNAALVERMVEIRSVWERGVATPAEVRPIQSLPIAVRDPTLDHARVIREARVHHVLGI